MNLSHDLARLAIQMAWTSLGLFFKLVVPFVGGTFVVDRVGFFLVDGFLFHGAGSGKDRSRLFATFSNGSVTLVLLLDNSLRRSLGRSPGKFHHRFPLSFLFNGDDCLTRPAERRNVVGFRSAEFLVPVGRGGSRLGVLFVDCLDVLVLLVQRFGHRFCLGENRLVFGKGCGYWCGKLGRRFVGCLAGGFMNWRRRGRWRGVATIL